MARALALPPAVGLTSTNDRVLARVRELDVKIAESVDSVWVAGYGPRVNTLKIAMVVLHEAFQDVITEVRRRDSMVSIEERFVNLSAVAFKLASDFQTLIGPSDRALPARDEALITDGAELD